MTEHIRNNIMNYKSLSTKVRQLYKRLNGCTVEYDLSPYREMLLEINGSESRLSKLTNLQLQQISADLKKRVQHDGLQQQTLFEVFALVREAAWRELKLRPFDEQILGALAMQQNKLAEMQTGEGKTLTAVFPACLEAFGGSGVHILTFNDYLARRDAQWMGPVYQFLGLTVGFIQQGMTVQQRRQAYQADITYVTAKEAGFDYLRDSLCYEPDKIVQRSFNLAIIDEADSILIDEARIPLVIAGAADDHVAHVHQLAGITRLLEQEIDFEFDEYSRDIHLTDAGQRHVEKMLHCQNLYDPENIELLTRLHCALHAEYLLLRDVDYIVRNGKIELVDEFTGRVADKRRWPDGLQAALEAKENIDIQARGQILNSITLQHFLHLYPRRCAMTATAQAAEAEFREFYNLSIVVIPPHRECIRIDHQDVIFSTKIEKEQAILKEIIGIQQSGRPVLVGTRSVEESARLADALRQKGCACEVLNAKRDEYEAQIIAQTGKSGAVTISTNMAGRGTDIRLGGADEKEKPQVMELGGLYVIGTNKHESQRIDLQLRGRAGRQGDPGSSRFFISLEDDLFLKYRLEDLLPEYILNRTPDGEIDSPILSREIARIQRICEGQNLEIKKTLCKYSGLLEKQRVILFTRRQAIVCDQSGPDFFRQESTEKFNYYSAVVGNQKLENLCRLISLNQIDSSWSEYLAEIADIRESIHLKRVGGQDPYIEFQKLAIKIFDEMLVKLDEQLIGIFNSLPIADPEINPDKLGLRAPAATWTYLVNDNPFEHNLGLQLIGNAGMQIGAGILTPLLALQLLARKKASKLK
jgi:preprotein translocase subunit SecA